ncbi:MAG TPA: histidine kinase dimerization/phosphoacceptor domain -containing protein [Phenylobacterium sp.]
MAARTTLASNDPSLSLALAMVCASATPLLLLDGDCKVIASSVSFGEAFQVDPVTAVGQSLFRLGAGEWDIATLRSLMTSTISGDAEIESYETEVRRAGEAPRCVILNVRKLAYGDRQNVRLLVALNDVTEARAAAKANRELVSDNAVLMQEVRHRVANSLQIIASVMMLNARRTSSDELRGQLRDARNRVMSVADLQQQLALVSNEAVNIHSYLTKLCGTISASMIADPQALRLIVAAPETEVEAEVSVSLGLIVTELVINALKHGFPEDAAGSITVSYDCAGADWTLAVTDTGVGMPAPPDGAMAGLGTSIVEALARQLRAEVVVARMTPGTRVSIVHDPAAAIADDRPHSEPQVAV